MRHLAALLTISSALVCGSTSLAVTPLERLRGTITEVSPHQMTLTTTDGKAITLGLTDQTKYAGLAKSSLDEVQPGDFIGTATKGPPNFMVALEIVIFPESMRGTGEGQYPWDSIPDTTQGTASTTTSSTMTNGTVDTSHPLTGPTDVNSTMTNGTVSRGEVSGGGRTITVSYTDPKTKQTGHAKVLLPPTAPVVLVHPADQAIVTQGTKAFVIAAGEGAHLTALRVLAGENGITPPM